MIHIYHNILWSKYKGEVFSSLYNLSLEKRIDTSIIQIAKTSTDREGLSSVDLSYHRYPFKLLFNKTYDSISKLTLCFSLFKDVKNSKADLIVLPGYHLIEYWLMLLACVMTRKKRAVFVDSTRYDRPTSNFRAFFKRIFFSLNHGFFCYGQRSKEYLISLGVPPDKIIFRCQAAALPHSYRMEEVLRSRIQRNNMSVVPSYLYVGRLSQEKGLDTLIHAFKRIYQLTPSASLTIVGSGPLCAELRTHIASLGLTDAVRFTGGLDINQLADYYLNASCLILPSRSEPWGLVANEALSYGCPIIVSDRCGCAPDLIIDGKTGYVFQTDDVEDLYQKMLLIQQTLADATKVANDCINFIQNFTPVKAASQILDGCQAILSKTGRL
ncbi:glycosyltransferase family 4 protein [Collimonas antrihumi]|uniref:glycosyltransferase family 4 protein n=1 Tax=Collimonas antrihumi TaxID=1940615 RepID=UPI001B8D4F57|nr:glycosyltransferase [Collimonas antrihumi]